MTGPVDDLVTWLRERIAEDRASALACAGAPWVNDVPGMVHVDPAAIRENRGLRQLDYGYVACFDNSPSGDAFRKHIVRHDPRTALVQCDAHEYLLTFFRRMSEEDETVTTLVPHLGEKFRERFVRGLKELALAYQHSPGYREEWRP